MTFPMLLNMFLPLFLLSAGAYAGNLAGRDNIALEGITGLGAFTTFSILYSGVGIPFALAGAVVVGILCGILLFIISDIIKGDIFLAGLGLNLFLPALCSFISKSVYGHAGAIRIAGEMSFNKIILPLFFLLAGCLWLVFLELTPAKLLLMTAGSAPARLRAKRINPAIVRLSGLIASGIGAALAGAWLSLNLEAYTPGISAGKGWLALIIVFIARKQTKRLLPAILILAAASSLALYLQGILKISQTLITGFPYYISLLAIIFSFLARDNNKSSSILKRTIPADALKAKNRKYNKKLQ